MVDLPHRGSLNSPSSLRLALCVAEITSPQLHSME
jgi:hypothetical protein